MNEIKSRPVQSLTIGDVFTTQGHGPFVVVGKKTVDHLTTVDYREFGVEGRPFGRPSTFTWASLSTVLVMDRFYGPELYQY